VARRLPSIESLRELNQREGVVEEDHDETSGGPITGEQAGTRRTRRSSRISLPPSTVELLDRLDRSSQNSDPTEAPIVSSPVTEAPEPGTASTTTPRERRARRTSIRNFTNRLSGWLGVGPSRPEETRGDRSPIDANPSEAAQPQDQETADRATLDGITAAAEETPAPTQRLATGAVMIVQGFVQTTIPVRERRRRTASHAESSGAPSARDIISPQMEAQELSDSNVARIPATVTNGQAGPGDVSDITGNAESLGGEEVNNTAAEASAATESRPSVLPHTGERPATQESASSTSRSQNSIRSSLRSASRTQAQETLHQPDSAPPARFAGSENRPEPPSFAEQARMLGGLLRQVIRQWERRKY
jgi:hypothetical protein